MVRQISLAEARYHLNLGELTEKNGIFWADFVPGLKITFPNALPLDSDHEPIWPTYVADTYSDCTLFKLPELYASARSVTLFAGVYRDQALHLTSPRDCPHLLMVIGRNREVEYSDQDLQSDFARFYGATWHYFEPALYDFELVHAARDYWILPTPKRLRPILNRHANLFEKKVREGEQNWADYEQTKLKVRRRIERELVSKVKDWGWLPGTDAATLYYLKADGRSEVTTIYYTDQGFQHFQGLIQDCSKH